MRRKILLTVLALTLMLVSGCGNREAVVETEQETLNAEETGIAENIESEKKEGISEFETNQEEIEHEESIPSWYMDSEGIKSDALGLIIRKDNTVFDSLGFFVNFGIYTPDASGTGGRWDQLVFSCDYYSGDLDDYISEHSNMEKGEFGDIAYAHGGIAAPDIEEIVFVGNGVVIYAYISDMGENESLNDYLNRIDLIKAFDESPVNCLAYIADDGLYCPALQIKLSTKESEHNIAQIGVYYCVVNGSVSVSISDESVGGKPYYIVDASNAQEVVDMYVEGAIEPDEYKTVKYTAIEGTVELNLGEYSYLGRGVTGEYDWSDTKEEEWLFYSDELTWSVGVRFEQGNQYEDYICVIESLN